MQRITTATRKLDLFGPGKDGFTSGNVNSKIAPTQLEAKWFNNVQEEVANFIESLGLTLDPDDRTQLYKAAKGQTTWQVNGSNVVRPYQWISESNPSVVGGGVRMLVDTAKATYGVAAPVAVFDPPNTTSGRYVFTLYVQPDVVGGALTDQTYYVEGHFKWFKIEGNVTAVDIEVKVEDDGMPVTLGTYNTAGQVAITVTPLPVLELEVFNVVCEARLFMLPYFAP